MDVNVSVQIDESDVDKNGNEQQRLENFECLVSHDCETKITKVVEDDCRSLDR